MNFKKHQWLRLGMYLIFILLSVVVLKNFYIAASWIFILGYRIYSFSKSNKNDVDSTS